MKLMHKACLILCFTVLLYGLSGCGRNQSEKKLLKDETRLLQEQLNKDTQDLNRRNKEYDEQQKQVDFARQKEEAEKKAELQKEIEEKAKEQERAAAALKGFDTVILEPKVHFSKSLKDNSSYEFIGPKLADIKTLFARKDWPGLIKLINGPDRSPPGTVTVYSEEIKQAISRLRDWSFFFLLKTTYKLPPTQYDRPASESKCYHFFYVAVPLPTEKDEDLLVQDPPFEYYFYGKQPPLTPGWELHPDGKGIMMEWSPRYSDIFIYVGVDDELWKNPNSIHRRLINLSSKYSEALNKLNVRVREIGDMNNSQRNQKILELREQIKETLSNMLETE